MSLKNAPTDIISVEIIFKDYVTFNENKIYLTEDVPEHIAEFFKEKLCQNTYFYGFLHNFKNNYQEEPH